MAHGNTASERSATDGESFDGLNELCGELLDDVFLNRLAARLAEHFNWASDENSGELLDAHAVARLLGCNRAFVYEHQAELGAIRLGAGPKARLRFDREQVEAFIDRREEPKPRAEPPRPRTPRRRARNPKVKLLPIKGRP